MHRMGWPLSCRRGSQQRPVDLVGVRPADVVRATLDRHDRHVCDQFAEPCGGRLERQDPVVRAVECQGRDVDLRQVLAEVGQPRVYDGVARMRR
jgi:hypothetical protein